MIYFLLFSTFGVFLTIAIVRRRINNRIFTDSLIELFIAANRVNDFLKKSYTKSKIVSEGYRQLDKDFAMGYTCDASVLEAFLRVLDYQVSKRRAKKLPKLHKALTADRFLWQTVLNINSTYPYEEENVTMFLNRSEEVLAEIRYYLWQCK